MIRDRCEGRSVSNTPFCRTVVRPSISTTAFPAVVRMKISPANLFLSGMWVEKNEVRASGAEDIYMGGIMAVCCVLLMM